MKELIEQIKLKADSIPTNTKENRRIKGAYIDCLMMVKEASKNLVQPDVSSQVCHTPIRVHSGTGRYDAEGREIR